VEGQLDRSAMTALQNIAGNTTQGSITSGTFEFDEATMRSLITEWLELAQSYDESFYASEPIALIDGPGLDFASQSHAEAANASGKAYLEYLQNNRDYCYAQAQLFQNALHDYLGIEHTNVTVIGAAGTSDENDSKAGF
jgi:hypothetical protein